MSWEIRRGQVVEVTGTGQASQKGTRTKKASLASYLLPHSIYLLKGLPTSSYSDEYSRRPKLSSFGLFCFMLPVTSRFTKQNNTFKEARHDSPNL